MLNVFHCDCFKHSCPESLIELSCQQSTVSSFSDRARLEASQVSIIEETVKNPNAAPKEHNEDCQRRVAQMDNDQKRQTTFRESSKVISFFILPFSHTWVQFFLLKNKMIQETHLPLLFTISRGQLAGYYENF